MNWGKSRGSPQNKSYNKNSGRRRENRGRDVRGHNVKRGMATMGEWVAIGTITAKRALETGPGG